TLCYTSNRGRRYRPRSVKGGSRDARDLDYRPRIECVRARRPRGVRLARLPKGPPEVNINQTAAREFVAEAVGKAVGAPPVAFTAAASNDRYAVALGSASAVEASVTVAVREGRVLGWQFGARSGATPTSLAASMIDRFGLGDPAGY